MHQGSVLTFLVAFQRFLRQQLGLAVAHEKPKSSGAHQVAW